MKNKALLVMPALVIPFLTLAFYALGGGSGAKAAGVEAHEGLNMKVPDAKLKNEETDKLGFYTRADKDSSKMKEWMKNDPYYQRPDQSLHEGYDGPPVISLPRQPVTVAPDDELMTKIAKLQSTLQSPSTGLQRDEVIRQAPVPVAADVDRLESMMHKFRRDEEDPSLRQLSEVMDKILDVQYPERVLKDTVKEGTGLFYPVRLHSNEDTIADGFYGIQASRIQNDANAIGAVVNEDQVLANGSVVKLRLLQDVFIDAYKVPAGTFVFGECNLRSERLDIQVTAIRCGANLFPVKLRAYDMDGIAGLAVPAALARDVAKQSADKGIQSIGPAPLDPSLKAQATVAGIQTAKSLLSRKVKLVKITVKAGYRLLLF